MSFIEKDAMHAKGGTKSLDIINAITDGIPMLSKHF